MRKDKQQNNQDGEEPMSVHLAGWILDMDKRGLLPESDKAREAVRRCRAIVNGENSAS